MTDPIPLPRERSGQDELYGRAVAEHGPAVARLAQAYEADGERRQDLLQEVHFALWRSLATFDGRCSLRTWVYRVAHNVATSHALRDRRLRVRTLVSLEALEAVPVDAEAEELADARLMRERLAELLRRLAPLDRQLVVLYLEGLEAAEIGEVTGLSAANVATKIHRIKKLLAARVRAGGSDV